MRVKVEQTRAALESLQRGPDADREDYLRRLAWVAEQPIGRSESHCEPGLPTRGLRRFTFGTTYVKIAIFAYDASRGRMRVLKCRLLRPRTPAAPPRGNGNGMGRPRRPRSRNGMGSP